MEETYKYDPTEFYKTVIEPYVEALKQRAVNPCARLKEIHLVRTDSLLSRCVRVRLLSTQARMCGSAHARIQDKKLCLN